MINPFDIDYYNSQIELDDDGKVIWHSNYTIYFGSLLDDEWDWGRNEWTAWTMDPDDVDLIRDRINDKIEAEYFFREIGVLPPAKFKHNLVKSISSIVSYLGPVYTELLKEIPVITKVGDDEIKERHVFSDYPQSQLNPDSEDYASSAVERGTLRNRSLSGLEAIEQFNTSFIEPDSIVLKTINTNFINLL